MVLLLWLLVLRVVLGGVLRSLSRSFGRFPHAPCRSRRFGLRSCPSGGSRCSPGRGRGDAAATGLHSVT